MKLPTPFEVISKSISPTRERLLIKKFGEYADWDETTAYYMLEQLYHWYSDYDTPASGVTFYALMLLSFRPDTPIIEIKEWLESFNCSAKGYLRDVWSWDYEKNRHSETGQITTSE